MPRRLINQDRRRERRAQQFLQDRLSRSFERRMRSEIANTMEQAASNIELGVEIDDEHQARVQTLLRQDWATAIETFSGRILESAKSKYGPDFIKQPDEESLFQRIQADFIRRFGAQKVNEITATTREQMANMIERGRSEGLGVDEIARNMRSQIPALAGVRAHVIARTETHGAANFASKETAQATNLSLRKEWIAAGGSRTREDHAAADGQVVDMNDAFSVGGYNLQYPGDPSGPAGQVINCRCAQGFVESEN